MAVIKSEFVAEPDKILFMTQTNGDRIEMVNVHLGAEAASNLAALVNGGQILTVVIKESAGA